MQALAEHALTIIGNNPINATESDRGVLREFTSAFKDGLCGGTRQVTHAVSRLCSDMRDPSFRRHPLRDPHRVKDALCSLEALEAEAASPEWDAIRFWIETCIGHLIQSMRSSSHRRAA